jgi:hypothetical protein
LQKSVCHYWNVENYEYCYVFITLSSIQQYRIFKQEGYTYAVFHLLISDLQVQLDNITKVRRVFNIASSVFSTDIEDFWILGLISWRRYLEGRLFIKIN